MYIAAATAVGMAASPAHAATTAYVELALLVDVSGSVSAAEFALQRDAYVAAFQSATIQNAITRMIDGRVGAIAVTYICCSGSGEQQQTVGWTLIDSAAAANAFAAAISGAPRPYSGSTAIGAATNFAAPLFGTNSFDSARQVIDVSGDGSTNDGIGSSTGRANALAAGVDQINGIVIGGSASVLSHYQTSVIGGTNAFVLSAATFADFQGALEQMLLAEILNENPIPERATWGLMIVGFAMLAFASRRRRSVAAA